MLASVQIPPIPSLAAVKNSAEDKQILPKINGEKFEIIVNSSLPLSGEVAILGTQVLDGMTLFFNKLKLGKKQGLIIHLNALDDGFETNKTRSNVTTLAEQSPLFLSLLGTRSVLAVSKEVQTGDISLLFPLEGADTTQSKALNNIVYFRPNYEKELEALVEHAVTKLNKKKIGFFYEASDSGEAALTSIKEILKKYNLTLHAEGWYPAQSLNITKAANEMAEKAPSVIICVSKSRATYNFIRQILNKGLHKTIFMGLSGLENINQTLSKSRGVSLITSSVVPDPVTSETQIAAEFRADLQKFMSNKKPTPYSFEGYINAALLYEVLKITPRPFTQSGIIQTVEKLTNVRFKGLELRFDAATRTLSNKVYVLNSQPNKNSEKAKASA